MTFPRNLADLPALACRRGYLLLALAGVVFLIARIFLFGRFQNVLWDEAVYIGMGKFIYSGGEAGLWEPLRPIGLPLLLGLFWKTGISIVMAGKILAAAFAILYVLLSCILARAASGRGIAALSAAFALASPLLFFESSQIMTEIPAAIFVIMAVYFFLRDSPVISGVCAGVAFAVKYPAGLILPALLASSFILRKRREWHLQMIVSFFFVVAPLLVAFYVIYGSAIEPLALASYHQANPVHAVSAGNPLLTLVANVLYYPVRLAFDNPLLAFASIGILLAILSDFKKKETPLLVALAFFLGYFTLIPNKQLRYGLLFLPFFSYFAARGFVAAYSLIGRWKLIGAFFLSGIIILSAGVIGYADRETYNWLASANPHVRDFYVNVTRDAGMILTADPTPVAYVDRRAEPFYYSVFAARGIYDGKKEKADVVIYSPDPFPCQYFGEECEAEKGRLFSAISSENTLVASGQFYNQSYYVFKRR